MMNEKKIAGSAPFDASPSSIAGVSASARLYELDGMRGIAALIVVLWHCYAASAESVRQSVSYLSMFPLSFVINGSGAVMFFFVLSGFVLALPYETKHPPSYRNFIMRRFCRIYLPFLASMLFALILYSIVPHRSLAGLWLPDLWHNPSPLPLNSVIHEIMLTGVIPQNDFVLNGPAWSLVHELRISMMLPFMVMLVGRYPLRWIGAVTIGVALLTQGLTLSIVINGTIDSPLVWIKSLFDTLAVMPCFMAGIFLARYRHAILSWVTALGASWRAALWLIGLLPFCLFDAFTQRLVVILSSVVLIVMTLSSARAKRIMLSKPCAWLGKISYSLYLVHVPILLASIQASDTFLPSAPASNAIVTAVVVGLSLACATLFHYAIEAPATRLGKSMTANRGIEDKSCR